MDRVLLDSRLKAILYEKGIETLYPAGGISYPKETYLEAPVSLKWAHFEFSARISAFSYLVSGYCMAGEIGRYCSIGENVQIGRQDHPMDWVSTHPFQYLADPIFDVGKGFDAWKLYHRYRSHFVGVKGGTVYPPLVTRIGHDVWIGHGSYIRAGIKVGDGAIVAAQSVVVKDVPPYAIVGGNPARVIRFRFSEEIIRLLENSQWWSFAPWDLNGLPFDEPCEFCGRLQERIESRLIEVYRPGYICIGELI